MTDATKSGLRAHLPLAPRREEHFRWRSHEVTRVEGLTDAVFAFAVTLLVVALEVPHTFQGLMNVVRGFPAFVICFTLLMSFWDAHYRYQPLGTIGGDYCDLLPQSAGAADYLYFLMGDVAGKGVAAALLMSHLSATVRSLVRAGAGLDELMLEANRTLRKYSPEAHYMTLVGGRARSDGRVEILNAGHTAPIVLRKTRSETISSTAPPIGLFDRRPDSDAGLDGPQVVELALEPGDTILLYTDGLTEASNAQDQDYGSERLMQLGARLHGSHPATLVAECLKDLKVFLDGAPRSDDLAVMALRRE